MLKTEKKIPELLANVKTNILGKDFWGTWTATSWVVGKHVSIVQNVWIVSEQEERQRFGIHFYWFVCRMHIEFFLLHIRSSSAYKKQVSSHIKRPSFHVPLLKTKIKCSGYDFEAIYYPLHNLTEPWDNYEL